MPVADVLQKAYPSEALSSRNGVDCGARRPRSHPSEAALEDRSAVPLGYPILPTPPAGWSLRILKLRRAKNQT